MAGKQRARTAGVSAYAIDPKSGALKLLNKQNSAGELPNQVVIDPSGRVAATVNYKTGDMALLPVHADGTLGEPFAVKQSEGKPISPRGDGPHAHGVVFTRDSRWLFEAELGLDRVYSYRLDISGKKLTAANPPYVTLPPGSGPRRLQLSPDERFLYVNRQDDGKVSVFAVNQGKLPLVQEIETNPNHAQARGGTAEIKIDHQGRFLYVSLRSSSTIAVYSVDRANGKLTLAGRRAEAKENHRAISPSVQTGTSCSRPIRPRTMWSSSRSIIRPGISIRSSGNARLTAGEIAKVGRDSQKIGDAGKSFLHVLQYVGRCYPKRRLWQALPPC